MNVIKKLAFAMTATALSAAASDRSEAAAPNAIGLQVVELFQSQGCSSCPPANANILKIADDPHILALSWQVTYWDRLGWRDSFGKPAYTERQHAYARALGHNGVWTPQVVINGRGDVVGADGAELGRALTQLARDGDAIEVSLSPNKVRVSGASPRASVYLVRYDPHTVQVPIGAGENSGQTLPHRNIVRDYRLLGSFEGGAREWPLPAGEPGLKTAVLVQADETGPILGAAHD